MEKGITLIALIITIVVLLILAVVSINAIQDTDIIGQTENTANTYNESVANEKNELGNYSTILGQYSEKYPSKPYDEYKVGDVVTVKNGNIDEEFYVLKDSSNKESKVLLLAKQCIDTENLVQSADANWVYFSTEGYWENEDIKEETLPIPESHIAAKAAYDYGTQFGVTTGRLLKYSEASELYNYNSVMMCGDNTNGYLHYWLGTGFLNDSPDGPYFVNCVNGFEPFYYSVPYGGNMYGVRPVIEISKSKVTAVTE